MAADADSDDVRERRAYPRVPLDAPFFVTLRRDDGTEVPALVVDFGRGGLQVALPPGSAESFHAWLSHAVLLLGLPASIDAKEAGCPGIISWVSAERCGVRLAPALAVSDEKLLEIAASL